jgi:hypothetical protein
MSIDQCMTDLLDDDPVFLELDEDDAEVVAAYLELRELDEDAARLVAALVRKLLTPAGMLA